MNYLYLLFTCATVVEIHSDQNILLTKKNDVPGRDLLNRNLHSSFHQFLQHTSAYIDKTSLIKYILSDNFYAGRIIYTAPRGWGKTLNLQLLKFFLGIELGNDGKVLPQEETKAYQFFKHGKLAHDDGTVDDFKTPPFISSYDEIIDTYLAKYPVISLDFSSLDAVYEFDKFKEKLRDIVGNEFAKHSIAVGNLCNKRINAYNRIVEETTCTQENYMDFLNMCYKHEKDEGKLESSLHLLNSLLYTVYESKVIVMIDEYDSFVSSMYVRDPEFEYFGTDKKNLDIEYFYKRFLQFAVKSDTLMHKAIICGLFSFDLSIGKLCEKAFHTEIYYTHTDFEWYPYYGFSIEEVNAAFEYANISGELADEARSLYGGYHVHNSTDLVSFVPFSIVNFIHFRKLDYYWSKEKVPKFTLSMLRHKINLAVLSSLMFDCCFDYSIRTRLRETELTLYESKPYIDIADFGEIITNTVNFYVPWYLSAIGWLTTFDYLNGTHCSKIPNQEARFMIGKGFLDAEVQYGCETDAAKALIQLLENRNQGISDLIKEFKNILAKDKVNTRYGLKHELRLRVRFYDVVKKATQLCNYTEVIQPETTTTVRSTNELINETLQQETNETLQSVIQSLVRKAPPPVDPNFNYELKLAGSSIFVSKNGFAAMFEMKFDRRDKEIKEFIIKELWPKTHRYFFRHPETKLLSVILIKGLRCNESLMYINYTFKKAQQIPKTDSPKLLNLNFLMV